MQPNTDTEAAMKFLFPEGRAWNKEKDEPRAKVEVDPLFEDVKTEWAQHFAPTFSEHSQPAHSCISISLNFFFHAAFHYFGQDNAEAKKFMVENLFDILMFSETIRERIGFGEQGLISEDRLEMVVRMIQAWVKTKAEKKTSPSVPQNPRSKWRRFLDWLFKKK